jgi:hypothetical protein
VPTNLAIEREGGTPSTHSVIDNLDGGNDEFWSHRVNDIHSDHRDVLATHRAGG